MSVSNPLGAEAEQGVDTFEFRRMSKLPSGLLWIGGRSWVETVNWPCLEAFSSIEMVAILLVGWE